MTLNSTKCYRSNCHFNECYSTAHVILTNAVLRHNSFQRMLVCCTHFSTECHSFECRGTFFSKPELCFLSLLLCKILLFFHSNLEFDSKLKSFLKTKRFEFKTFISFTHKLFFLFLLMRNCFNFASDTT